MPVTRPTAEIELAVADAINVEKAVADKSNSKLVYINLCSQELLHRSDNMDSTTDPNSEPTANPNSDPTANPNSEPTAVLNNVTDYLPTSADIDVDVDEALRNAGLLSDSPPDSPKEDGPDNVFEIDCQPELDIYGDFEYDLEDENDFIGANAIKTSKVQQEDTKIKMVFSTLDFNKSDSDWRFEDHEAPVVVENANEDKKSSLTEGGEDEILGECEELYGPDKEPLISKYPEIKPPDLITENNVAQVQNEQGSIPNGNRSEKLAVSDIVNHSSCGIDLPKKPLETEERKEKKSHTDKKKQPDNRSSVFKKVSDSFVNCSNIFLCL